MEFGRLAMILIMSTLSILGLAFTIELVVGLLGGEDGRVSASR